MEPIRSFVFLDLEATSCEASSRPKVTELCLATLHRSAVLSSGRRLPRVMDKLLLAVYPNKPIPGLVCDLTGLNNENLAESERAVLDASLVSAVCGFLHRQPPPVALVAHNGLKFDFPLLKTELLKLNTRLPDGLRYCDSLMAFRETQGPDRDSDEAVPSPRPSLSLESLYQRYVSQDPRCAHTAEDDVLALIQVVRARADTLLPWMDRNSQSWDGIPQMYATSPVKPADRTSNRERTRGPAKLCLTFEN
ncbi:three prime repair exonuclease 2-like [Branchiostoma floridae]|uniref:Three prime repair exonuclease 2-like n=1 Tax=Branchiostoma floridae TaxID=7739 RepID=A0A9J7LI01_BRAFL|nr:three prime repair exonuclease 2-like [Branchiostoma floridae]